MRRLRFVFPALAMAAASSFASARLAKIVSVRQGDELIYAFTTASLIWPCLAALFALVATALLVTGHTGWRRLLAVLPLILTLASCLLAHGLATGHAVIGPASLLLPGYSYLARSEERLVFDELAGVVVRVTAGTDRTGSRTRRATELEFVRTDGSTVSVPVGNLAAAALPEAMQALETHQVPIEEKPK